MKTSELLAHLKGLQVRLWADGGELRLSAPKGVLTAELKAQLSARKAELLEALSSAASTVDGETERKPRTIPRVAPGAERPLSFTQKRLWFLQQLEPTLSAYNIPMSWRLRGPVDEAALEGALHEVLGRHEVLRSAFPPERGRPRQQLLSLEHFPLERWTPASGQEDGAWRAEVRRRLEELAHEPFDLATGPLVRPVLARLATDEHVLFVLVHHIAFDGSSIDLFMGELKTAYAALAAGRPSPLAPLELQYTDFASWQDERMRGPALERLLDYWREKLRPPQVVLDLPLDRPRPPVQTYGGAKASHALPASDVDALERLAKEEGATLFMAWLGAYEALLHRYTGQDDVVVASPIAGRHFEGVSDLVGFFANTLVLRTSVAGNPSFRELLGRVRDTCLGAFEHQDMPFERLVDELAPERTLSYTPLFQTMFLIEEAYGRADTGGPLSFEPYELSTHVARTDLMVYAYHVDREWSVWAEYNTDLFDDATISRLLANLARLVSAAVAEPDRPLSELPLLTDAERTQLLETWVREDEPFPETAVHHRFEEQVDRTPDATALVFPALDDPAADEVLSYRELDARANRLAHHLAARGAKPGELVGMCLERSSDMLVCQLAIQKAGCAYVPLDPSYPADRLVYMAEDSGLTHVVTHGELDELYASLTGVAIVHLEREAQDIAAQSDQRTGIAVDVKDRMYVIYTSGSTGKPKGVELEHRSVSNFLTSIAEEPGLNQGELLLALTTPSFDISVLELFLPLMCGATVAIAPREATADGAKLRDLIGRLEPDVLQATPASWRLLLVAGWEGAPDKLRAFSGGEAIARELADELIPLVRELWNLYGPTEATIWSTVRRLEADGGPITIGKPIKNTRIYVLDRNHQPVPVGVTGELWIAGDGLARGYLDRPELNEERFVPDPFRPGQRMYITGDLARWRLLSDDGGGTGEVECLGRIDHQVKLRGFRIELGEIESVLADVSGVHECVSIVREDTPGDQRLVAYYTTSEGGSVDHDALRAAGRSALPAYMVPSLFQELDALPLTPNGKVDRNALHALESVAPGLDVEYVPPRDETEEAIAAVWSEVLGLDQVTVNTNFFDLGGHSLLLAQVHARLQDSWPALSIIELFQYPTVSALAGHVKAPPPTKDTERGNRLSKGRQALMQRRRIRK